MLKILQPKLQQCMNSEFPDAQSGFRKARGIRDEIANIHWITEKAKEFQKNIYFCFIDYAKTFDYVEHNKLWKILKEMGIPDHLTCLLRNLYVGQEATAGTGHGTANWFQIGKGVRQGCILSPCLFNLYTDNIMQNTKQDGATSWDQDFWDREQDGRRVGGCGEHLSPWIHQEYTLRYRSACRTPTESGQVYLTSGKEYIDARKTQ